jgi:hypothetical protein
VVIFSYSIEEARRLYPQMSDECKGRVPRESSYYKDLDRRFEQRQQTEKNLVEVAHAFDISNDIHLVFGGKACEILESNKGDSYPFTFTTNEGKEESYIPVLNLMCLPASEGMYNHGLGEVLYDLATLSRQLMNMGVNHALDVADPLWNISLPKGEAAKFFEKMRSANEMRQQGRKGFITTEYDPNSPGGNQVGLSSLVAQNNFNELVAMFDRLDKEVKRFGINLDEIDFAPNTTATEILAREESASAFVKQTMEYNSSEVETAVLITIEMIKRFVSKNDKTPLNLTTMIDTGETKFRPDDITLGMISDELRKYHYFVKVNSRSGAIQSNIMEQAQNAQLLQYAQPGSKAWASLVGNQARLNDREIDGNDFMPEGLPTGAEAGPNQPAMASETQRMTINPRMKPMPTF